MVRTRTISPRHAGLRLCHAGVAVMLCCGPVSSMSFADVALQENQPMVTSPTIDTLLGRDPYTNVPPVGWQVTSEGKRSCFWGDNQGQVRGSEGERELPDPSPFFCARSAADVDDISWSGHEANGDHARSTGNWSEAERAYASAVGLLDRTADKDFNQDLAAILNKLGATRFKQNDFSGAETAFRRALAIYTATKGADDLHVADTLDLLGSALLEQQQGHALAGPLFYRAWAIREATLTPDHPAIADSLHHLAVGLYADNLAIAIPLFLRSKEIREKVFGGNHPLVVISLNAMARLYEAHNRPDLAIPLYQDALSIQEKVFGPNASETLHARSNLDMAHRQKDNSSGGDPNARK